MHPDCMKLHGRALLDYMDGETDARIALHREDGESLDLPVALFFRGPAEFLALDRAALDACRGRVLDVGAGAGSHVLWLQERGVSVCALDFLPEAVDVMRRRGVREIRRARIEDFRAEPFDTLLMLMNGIGIVETLVGLRQFLDKARPLVKPDGQILFDGADLRHGAGPTETAYQEANRRAGRYFGEYRFRLEYKGRKGPWFGSLFIDPATLEVHARQGGWSCEFLFEHDDGAYVVRLTPA